MCFDNDDGSYEFGSDEIVVARKDHKCSWCGKAIAKGSQYQYCAGKADGTFFSFKVCNLCYQDTLSIVRREIDEGCQWHEAWPRNREDQQEWFAYAANPPKRATEIVDLKSARAELDKYRESKRQQRVNANG